MPLPFVQLAASIWRQYVIDGDAGSGLNNTARPEIITWGTKVEEVLGEHDTDIDALQAQQTTNTGNISTNTTNIATNTSDVTTLKTEVYPITRGGTGGNTAAAAIANLGLVDLFFPVGSVVMNTDGTNPGTYLTGTTWVAKAAGRALVGVGNNGESNWTAGLQQGSETHALTEAELPAHTHGAGTLVNSSENEHDHSITTYVGDNGGTPTTNRVSRSFTGGSAETQSVSIGNTPAHTHTISGDTASVGSGTAHNNIQPSEGIYVWERTV